MESAPFPYLHGFSSTEQNRLQRQAQMAEQVVYRDIDFSDASQVLEVGCGVGAQSEILLRRFPGIHLHGVDLSEAQLAVARQSLAEVPWATGRYQLQQMDATAMAFPSRSFDGAFLCWILEHAPNPAQILSEVRRVLKPGGRVFVTEVHNATFFLDPYSPATWHYWMAFNDYQLKCGGDPFIGAKLGNMLLSLGYEDIRTEIKTYYFDNRQPDKRAQIIQYWAELLLSAADQLIAAEVVTADLVEEMKVELNGVKNNPNAVFFYAFMQASARVFR